MAKFDLVIRGGRALVPEGELQADIAALDGAIVEIAASISGSAREEIDASGLHVFPGLIDPHVHFNDPGRTNWEGFATGSAALAAGGGTCFFDMPLNASPPTLDGISFDAKRRAAEAASLTDFALWGGLTPDNLDRLEELAERGVIGLKAFMCDSGIDDFPRADDLTLHRGMQIAARLGLLVAVHAESQEITQRLSAEARRDGRVSWHDYLASRPIIAETEAISRAIHLAGETGCKLHIVHVSTPRGVDIVRRASAAGVDVTCETCPHYLLMTSTDLEARGASVKCAPPLRSSREAARLWKQLGRGEIDFVASDHSPSPPSMKMDRDSFSTWGGIAGVQSTLLSLLGRAELSPRRIAEATAETIAGRFGLKTKGKIAVSFDADFAIVDLKKQYVLGTRDLLDRHRANPYVGRTFSGTLIRTIARGKTIYRDNCTMPGLPPRLIRPRSGGEYA